MTKKQKVSKEISEFIIVLTKYFEHDEEELTDVWLKHLEEKKIASEQEETNSNGGSDEYSNLKRPALVELCKEMNLKSGGSKKDLIERIENEKKIKNLIHIENPMRTVVMNKKGDYVDPLTFFCFDPYTKRVIGKEVDGEIAPLTLNDVEFCKEHHYRYVIPETFK